MTLGIDICDPNCHGHAAGDLVEDPRNCNQYYICLADESTTDHALVCENGHFDTGLSECVPGEACTPTCPPIICQVACTGPGDIIANPIECGQYYLCDAALNAIGPYECPIETPFFNGKNCVADDTQCCQIQCTPYCNPGDIQIIDPLDCTKYYICVDEGNPLETNHFSCPDGENFDIASSKCKEGATCITLCGS